MTKSILNRQRKFPRVCLHVHVFDVSLTLNEEKMQFKFKSGIRRYRYYIVPQRFKSIIYRFLEFLKLLGGVKTEK